MSGVTLRDAREADRAAILELTLAAYGPYAEQMPLHWERYREGIVANLERPHPAEQIVAELEGRLVGSVLLYPPGVEIHPAEGAQFRVLWPYGRLLAVAPEARGRGVGTAITQECLRRAKALGAEAMAIHTLDLMGVADGMYEPMGFVRAPELDFVYPPDLRVKGYRFNFAGQTAQDRAGFR